jgi:putative nucleotidyltransferase with HDIG domain
MNVVNALAAALEAKDRYTQGHSLRVALWAKDIAEEMGLSDKEREMVYMGGLLHDIGKVGVREYILLKTSKLTPEEEKEIRTHPSAGAKILKPANFPQEVVEAVLYHHEDYDGGGYPEGIAGEKIPLLARIIRVVDSYDAMKSDRPYRKTLPQKWVIEELNRCSGKQFDPAVVETVKKLIEQGKLT